MQNVKCQICNRKLTNPISMKRKLGAVCLRKWREGKRGIQTGIIDDRSAKSIQRRIKE